MNGLRTPASSDFQVGVPGKPHASSLLFLLPREDFASTEIPTNLECYSLAERKNFRRQKYEIVDLTFLASSFVGLNLDLTLTHSKKESKIKSDSYAY